MKYCDKHNQVGFFKKPKESAGFAEIVDFLKGSHIRYALTHNPTVYDSLVKQFWQTATASTLTDRTLELSQADQAGTQFQLSSSIVPPPPTSQPAPTESTTIPPTPTEPTFLGVGTLKQTKQTRRNAIVKLVKKVKKMEKVVKSRRVVLTDSEDEVIVLSQIKTKRRNVKTGVRRRLDAEDVSTGFEDVSTGFIDIKSASEKVSSGGEHDELAVKRLQEELELSEAQKKRMAQVQEAAQFYTEEDWDTIRAKLEANADLVKEIAGEDAQQRQYMATYMKNQGGWKLAQIKKLTDEGLKVKYEYLMRSMERFVLIDTEKESRKRTGEELQTESSKNLKSDIREDVSVPKEKDKEHKDWLVQGQMALGKDFLNPFMADNMPKIVWLSTHHIYVCKELASPQGGGTGRQAGRGGGRTRGRSGDQGDGRNDGQSGQVGGQGSKVNDGVGGLSDSSTIIAQQLHNLLPTIVAQVGDQDAVIRNQGASIKTLDIQIGQMSKNNTLLYKLRQMTIPFPSRLDNHYYEEEEGNHGPKFMEAYGASHINNTIPRKEKDPGNRTVKYPKGIAENILVGIGKFTFPVDFIILDMPEDIKVPLILERPFLSTAHAKIDVYKRKITLRVGEEKIIFKSVKPASSIIKRVYMLSLRERMELNLEARLMGETLVLNSSLDPFLEDYIELNDNQLSLREIKEMISCPPLWKVRKFHNSIMKNKMMYKGNNVVGAVMNVPIFVGTFSIVIDFAVLENMDAHRDKGMGDVIVGEPFLREVGIKAKRFEGIITFYKGDDEVTYQMVRSHPRFKNYTNEQCNKIPPLLKDPTTFKMQRRKNGSHAGTLACMRWSKKEAEEKSNLKTSL
ncbi:putative ribonuclease H-like domain-containing protein [Tanacetum coccineum]